MANIAQIYTQNNITAVCPKFNVFLCVCEWMKREERKPFHKMNGIIEMLYMIKMDTFVVKTAQMAIKYFTMNKHLIIIIKFCISSA